MIGRQGRCWNCYWEGDMKSTLCPTCLRKTVSPKDYKENKEATYNLVLYNNEFFRASSNIDVKYLVRSFEIDKELFNTLYIPGFWYDGNYLDGAWPDIYEVLHD